MDDVAAQQERRRAHVNTACERCRQRKAKCDGNEPCDKCAHSNSQCIYTPRADDKRLRGNRPTTTQLTDLHDHRQVLNYLWQAVLNGSEQDVIHRVRSGVSIRDMADYINRLPTTSPPFLTSEIPDKIISDRPPYPPNDSASLSIELAVSDAHPASRVPGPSDTTNRSSKHSYLPHFSSEHLQARPPPPTFPRTHPTATSQSAKHPDSHLSAHTPSISFGHLPLSASIAANHYPTAVQNTQRHLLTAPGWQMLPRSTETSDSPIDSAFTSFRRAAAQAQSGEDSHTTWSHKGTSLIDATLLFRERNSDDPLGADAWASEFCRTFPVPWCTKLATVYTCTRLMQWMLDPSSETYAALPEIMRPTLQQLTIPHAPAIDAIPSPLLRDALINAPRDFVTSGLKAGAHVSWFLSFNEALIAVQHSDDANSTSETTILLSPNFCDHVDQPQNWKVGRLILEEMPELQDDPNVSKTQDTLVSPSYWL